MQQDKVPIKRKKTRQNTLRQNDSKEKPKQPSKKVSIVFCFYQIKFRWSLAKHDMLEKAF